MGNKVLIVDDEACNRELLEDLLGLCGYECEAAASGEEALARLTDETDLVLLDVMMPGMDGFEVVRWLRQDVRFRDLPVIMVTALNGLEDRIRAVEAGANDFIAKPVDSTELRVRTASLLKMKAAQDAARKYQVSLEATVEQRTMELRLALHDLSNSQRRTQQSCLDTIKRLARASEFKDARTGLHLERVSHYTAHIGLSLGLPQAEVDVLLHASAMHDVGKLGVPDSILSKPGLLTPDERAVMQQHTTIGGCILGGSDSELLQAGEQIAMTHHEKWDGSGYPRGIRGEEIPLFGRICAIADVFDALTTARPYKEAYDSTRAYAIIREGRGAHFDPRLVDLFFASLREIEAIQRRFAD
ncbi:MAG TPA: HD domain-containing phosphohydrolase [Chthonomonadaceae bacterium]|nr:HD domain-containing phosphohydrolase [Chthonomonadaceae bacterium]